MLINGDYYLFTTEQISYFIDEYLEKIEDVTIKDIYDLHLDEVSQEIELLNLRERQEQNLEYVEEYDEDGNMIRKQKNQIK